MKLNKYGLKITGLKKLAGELQANLPKSGGEYSPAYFQINYNTDTGEVWGDYLYSLGHCSWLRYHNENIIVIGDVSEQITMQQICDLIKQKLNEQKVQAHLYNKNIIAGGGKK